MRIRNVKNCEPFNNKLWLRRSLFFCLNKSNNFLLLFFYLFIFCFSFEALNHNCTLNARCIVEVGEYSGDPPLVHGRARAHA